MQVFPKVGQAYEVAPAIALPLQNGQITDPPQDCTISPAFLPHFSPL
jgi:hypothetical protein